MEDESVSLISPPKAKGKPVPQSTFMVLIAMFVVAVLALGLSLGLGFRMSWASSHSLSHALQDDSRHSMLSDMVGSSVVTAEQLVNSTELDLKTDFVVSDKPTIREFKFTVSQAYASPDGVQKPMILVNGQSPGPLIEANSGDTIRVYVLNQMENTSTSIHWHGIAQRNTPWMDGVTGVSQCAIPPGSNFTYEFQVIGQRGTFWYHAYTAVQYTDGLFGPIVIHDPGEMVPAYDDEKIIHLGDNYHASGEALLQSYLRPDSKRSPDDPGVEPLPDNFLINGRHTFNCSVRSSTRPAPSNPDNDDEAPACTGGQLYSTKVRPGHAVRLRLINHSSYMSFWFSIDNHTVTIVEMDGVEVEPIPSRGVYVNVGQRYSVIVRADQAVGSYHMRATLPQTCFVPYWLHTSTGLESIGYEARALLSYDDDPPPVVVVDVAGNTSNPHGAARNRLRGDVWEGCDDMPFDEPVPVRRRPAVGVAEGDMHSVTFQFQRAGEVNRISINRTSSAAYHGDAQLWQAMDQDFEFGRGGNHHKRDFRLDQQVLLVPEADKGVQIVINSRDVMEHPFHLHSLAQPIGHSFQIVGWGAGEYRGGGATTTWNLENPMRRDTVTVPSEWHVVIRFAADNPGIWALHCHVAWHMEGGMFVSFIERPEDLKALVNGMDPTSREAAESLCSNRK